MIFGSIFLAGIASAAAYLQADGRGWKLYAVALALVVLGAGGLAVISESADLDLRAQVSGPQKIKVIAAGAIGFGGLLMLSGLVIASFARAWLSPGKTALVAFLLAYAAIWLLA